jgi:hypothetical protein
MILQTGGRESGDDLDEVEPLLLRHAHRLERLDDADLLVVRPRSRGSGDTDHVVDAGPLIGGPASRIEATVKR